MPKFHHRKHKSKKKLSTEVITNQEEIDKLPKSLVFRRGKVGKPIKKLITDFRHVMEPYTAINLKESNSNTIKDFLKVAAALKVTHFVAFSTSTLGHTQMSVARVPRGPTLTFRVLRYSYATEVQQIIAGHQIAPGPEFRFPPLVVMNNFDTKQRQLQLLVTMLQNMFPPINVETVKLNECRRVILYDYNKETDEIEMRHYVITAVPTDISKPIKRLIQSRIPDLSKVNDISDYILGTANASDSEMSDVEDAKVEITQSYAGAGNRVRGQSTRSVVRLREVGPRLTLALIKVADGLFDGNILYHKYIKKTPLEIEELRKKQAMKEKQRQALQKQKEEKLKQKRKGKGTAGKEEPEKQKNDDQVDSISDDDDNAYYKEEVGEEPESMISQAKDEKRTKFNPLTHKKVQKKKRDEKDNGDDDDEGDDNKEERTPQKRAKSKKIESIR